MQAAAHTPTPWSSTNNSWAHTTIHADGVAIALIDISGEATEDNQDELEARMAADAAFIVEACNQHSSLNADRISLQLQVVRLKMTQEKLIESLTEMVDQHVNGILGISPACIERARAVLDEAGAA